VINRNQLEEKNMTRDSYIANKTCCSTIYFSVWHLTDQISYSTYNRLSAHQKHVRLHYQ